MTITIEQLRYLILAAELGSLNQAARRLKVKQSTLSRKLARLEDKVRIRLLHRTTRGALVTEAGRPFVEQARKILQEVDCLLAMGDAAAAGERGRIVVGFCSSLMAGPLRRTLSAYLAEFPDVGVHTVEDAPEALIRALTARTIDAMIAPGHWQIPRVQSRPVWSERLLLVVCETNPLAERERIHWDDLRAERFAVPAGGLGRTIARTIEARLAEPGYAPTTIVLETSLENILGLVPSGRFVAVATESSQGVDWPGVRFREIYEQFGPARLEYALHWRTGNANAALERFVKLVSERYPG